MKIECYQCKYGRIKPNAKYRCILRGWDKQKEVNATDSCKKGELNKGYGENE
ncbi:hypothetical protein [Aminipila sp.]|uniref:hypothetical protein n=1 Tax=Aminipila sp. TaxID=2060095 RepID=UPI00289BE215|nr:hypothetical protein [Aminipila sp.]